MRKISLFIFVLIFAALKNAAAEEEFTFLYSGAGYGAVHADSRLHNSKLGGLENRAKLLTAELKKDSDIFVFDGGNNCAGEVADPFRGEKDLDKLRTASFWESLFMLKYDAYALGRDDLASLDMIKQAKRKENVVLVSANAKSDLFKPFLRINKGGKKIFFTALNARSRQLKTINPTKALKAVMQEVNATEELVVLSSSLSYKESVKLIEEFPGIDMILLDKPSFPFFEHKKVNDTIVATPFLLGKKIGKLNLSFDNGQISKYEFSALAVEKSEMVLAADLADVIPACFNASHCAKKEGMVARCINPGKESECLYAQVDDLNLKILTIEDCKACDNSFVLGRLKTKFPDLNVTYIDYRSKEAKDYISKYEIDSLPAFLFDKSIDSYAAFEQGRDYFMELSEHYLMHPVYSGIFYFLDRTLEKGKLDVFVDIGAEESLALLLALKPYFATKNVDIHFLAKSDDIVLQEELRRILAVKELYPQKLADYLIARFESNIRSTYWSDLFGKLAIEENKVVELARSDDAQELLKKNKILLDDLNVGRGGVFLIDNRRIFAISNASGADLEDYIN